MNSKYWVNYMDERIELIEAMKLLVYLGITNPRGGNGSIRINEKQIIITPSGLAKHRLSIEDLVLYDLEEDKAYGKHKPSMELPLHVATYTRNPHIKTILHAHPPYTLALTDKGLKEWWMTGLVEAEYSIGKVEIVESAPPGSKELAENVANGFSKGARIVIVPRHGVFACGGNVHEALDAIIALEEVAKYVISSMIIELSIKE